jgi:hypothetical protein
MSGIAIRIDRMSKLYPAVSPRACPECSEGARHLGRAQSRAGDSLRSQRHDTTLTVLRGAPLWGSAGLRDALSSVFSRQSSVGSRKSRLTTDNSELKTDNSELKTDNSLSSSASPCQRTDDLLSGPRESCVPKISRFFGIIIAMN